MPSRPITISETAISGYLSGSTDKAGLKPSPTIRKAATNAVMRIVARSMPVTGPKAVASLLSDGKWVVDVANDVVTSCELLTDFTARTASTEKTAKKSLGWSYVRLPENVRKAMKKLWDKIDPADLGEDGKEGHPHITSKYGLTTTDPEEVRAAVVGNRGGKVRMGKTSLFEKEEGDILKVSVTSHAMHALWKTLSKLDNEDKFDEYRPHATLAYLKPGMGKKYSGLDTIDGLEFTFDSFVFEDKNDVKTEIALDGKMSKKAQAEPIPLQAKATDNHGNTFLATLNFKPTGGETTTFIPIISVQEESGKTGGRWGWSIETLSTSFAAKSNNNALYLDLGQAWYIKGVKDIYDEAMQAIEQKRLQRLRQDQETSINNAFELAVQDQEVPEFEGELFASSKKMPKKAQIDDDFLIELQEEMQNDLAAAEAKAELKIEEKEKRRSIDTGKWLYAVATREQVAELFHSIMNQYNHDVIITAFPRMFQAVITLSDPGTVEMMATMRNELGMNLNHLSSERPIFSTTFAGVQDMENDYRFMKSSMAWEYMNRHVSMKIPERFRVEYHSGMGWLRLNDADDHASENAARDALRTYIALHPDYQESEFRIVSSTRGPLRNATAASSRAVKKAQFDDLDDWKIDVQEEMDQELANLPTHYRIEVRHTPSGEWLPYSRSTMDKYLYESPEEAIGVVQDILEKYKGGKLSEYQVLDNHDKVVWTSPKPEPKAPPPGQQYMIDQNGMYFGDENGPHGEPETFYDSPEAAEEWINVYLADEAGQGSTRADFEIIPCLFVIERLVLGNSVGNAANPGDWETVNSDDNGDPVVFQDLESAHMYIGEETSQTSPSARRIMRAMPIPASDLPGAAITERFFVEMRTGAGWRRARQGGIHLEVASDVIARNNISQYLSRHPNYSPEHFRVVSTTRGPLAAGQLPNANAASQSGLAKKAQFDDSDDWQIDVQDEIEADSARHEESILRLDWFGPNSNDWEPYKEGFVSLSEVSEEIDRMDQDGLKGDYRAVKPDGTVVYQPREFFTVQAYVPTREVWERVSQPFGNGVTWPTAGGAQSAIITMSQRTGKPFDMFRLFSSTRGALQAGDVDVPTEHEGIFRQFVTSEEGEQTFNEAKAIIANRVEMSDVMATTTAIRLIVEDAQVWYESAPRARNVNYPPFEEIKSEFKTLARRELHRQVHSGPEAASKQPVKTAQADDEWQIDVVNQAEDDIAAAEESKDFRYTFDVHDKPVVDPVDSEYKYDPHFPYRVDVGFVEDDGRIHKWIVLADLGNLERAVNVADHYQPNKVDPDTPARLRIVRDNSVVIEYRDIAGKAAQPTKTAQTDNDWQIDVQDELEADLAKADAAHAELQAKTFWFPNMGDLVVGKEYIVEFSGGMRSRGTFIGETKGGHPDFETSDGNAFSSHPLSVSSCYPAQNLQALLDAMVVGQRYTIRNTHGTSSTGYFDHASPSGYGFTAYSDKPDEPGGHLNFFINREDIDNVVPAPVPTIRTNASGQKNTSKFKKAQFEDSNFDIDLQSDIADELDRDLENNSREHFTVQYRRDWGWVPCKEIPQRFDTEAQARQAILKETTHSDTSTLSRYRVCGTLSGPLPNTPIYAIEVLRNGVWHEGSEDIFSRDWMDKNLAEQYLAAYLKRSGFNAKNFRVVDFANQYHGLPFVSPNNPEVFYVQLGASGLVAGTSHVNEWKFYPDNENPDAFNTIESAQTFASSEVDPSTPWKTVRIVSSTQGLVQHHEPLAANNAAPSTENATPANAGNGRNGRYVTFSFNPSPQGENLVMTPTAAGVVEATDLVNEDNTGDGAFTDMIEDHLGNGWELVSPEDVGAMTSALLITNDIERDDQGNFTRMGDCWANIEHYQTTSEVAEFAAGRSVTWRKVQETGRTVAAPEPIPSSFDVQYKMTEEGTFWNRDSSHRSIESAQARILALRASPERRTQVFVRIIDAISGHQLYQTILPPHL